MKLNKSKAHLFFFIIIVAEIIFTRISGNGRALYQHTSSTLSMLFNFIKPVCLFPVYYVFARDSKRKIYWINIVLFCYWRMMQGWGGFIIAVAFYEVYFCVKYGKYKKLVYSFSRWSVLASLAAIGVGAGLYKFMEPIKSRIRFGSSGGISYIEALEKLVSRLTNFPITVLGIQNHERIISLYCEQGSSNWEVLSLFKSLTPRFLMPYKEFRTMANVAMQSLYPDITYLTSTGYNIFIYGYNLLKASFLGFLFWLLIYIFLLVISIKLIRAFDNGCGDSDILLFMFLFAAVDGTPIETLFSYNYIGLIYIIPIMILFGVIKVYKKLPLYEE